MNKLLLPILIILLVPVIYQSTPTEILKLKVFDAFVKTPEPSGNFVILNITEDDVEREGGWPIPRQRLAEIQVDLINNGAIGVGWVISFPQADRMGGDEIFSESLKFAPSVLAMFEDGKGNYPKTPGTVVLGEDNGGIMSSGVKENLLLLSNHALQGLAVAPTDIDQLVRRIPLLVKTPNNNGIEEISIRGIPPVKTDSLGRKWISWVNTKQTTLQEMHVAGKFVFVGVTANGVMPQIATPIGLLEPHKIQTALSESILIQNSPYIPDYALAVEMLSLVIFVSLVWFALHLLGITWGITIATVLMIITATTGYFLIQKGLLIDVSWTLISEFITGSIAFYFRFRQQYKLRQQIKKQFEHYLDPRQVKKLQDNPESLVLGGERRYCTFLFTDVRGFTALSEKLEPEEVTNIMNKVLTIQADTVKFYDGMVDKYIGDAMMAIFNAPVDVPDHETAAVLCAKEIQDKVKMANLGVEIGVGINTGYAVVGNMGSDTRFDYSAIGDAVNLAARLESSTKEVGEDIVIGYDTISSSNFSDQIILKELESIFVKGKEKPIKIYTLQND
jgi:adenylate cyclase